jgi:hypothetical protein
LSNKQHNWPEFKHYNRQAGKTCLLKWSKGGWIRAMGAPFNCPLSKKAKVGISGAQRLVSKNSKPADEMRTPGPICPNRKKNGDAGFRFESLLQHKPEAAA